MLSRLMNFSIVLCLLCHISASTPLANTKEIQEIGMAYGYVIGQDYTLGRIQNKFPDLQSHVQTCRLIFYSSPFGEGWKHIDEILKQYEEERVKLHRLATSHLTKEAGTLTRQKAEQFIDGVLKRAKGYLPENIAVTLLKHNARYQKKPIMEMHEGWKTTFRTKGHPKAGSLDFSINIPVTWKQAEGNRPHILKSFSRKYDDVYLFSTITIKPIRGKTISTNKEFQEYIRSCSLEELLPPKSKIICSKEYTLEDLCFLFLQYSMSSSRLDKTINIQFATFLTVYQSYELTFAFSCINYDGSEGIKDKYLNLFMYIMNSLIINNIYY